MSQAATRKVEVINGLMSNVQKLVSELMDKKLLDKCTHMEKTKISSLINELRYNARQIKNIVTL